MNFVWPVLASVIPEKVASGYRFGAGRTTGPAAHIHKGIDLGVYDTQVFAAGDGIVKRAYAYTPYGGPGIIDIDHDGGEWRTRYLHLEPKSFVVKAGDMVRAGQPLARAAMLTKGAAASHLHFEILMRSTKTCSGTCPNGSCFDGVCYYPMDPEQVLRGNVSGLPLVIGAAAILYYLARRG